VPGLLTGRRAGGAKLAYMEEHQPTQRRWIERELVDKEISIVGVTAATIAFFFAYYIVLRFGLEVKPFTIYSWYRMLIFSIFGGFAAGVRPDVIRRGLTKYIYLVGPAAYGISYVAIRLGYGRAGTPKFYEVCAETLPLLLIGIIIEAELFTHVNMRPFSIFVNLDLLATGEGASLLVVLDGKPSNGLFAATVSGMIAAFAIIIANAVNKPPEKLDPRSDKISAIADVAIRVKLVRRPTHADVSAGEVTADSTAEGAIEQP